MSSHWTDERILDRVYGLADDDGHLAICAECRSRCEAAVARRASMAAEEVSAERLTAQREQIYHRTESRRFRFNLRYVPAIAGAGALAFALLVYSPAPRVRKTAPVQISDAQLYADVYQMVASSEPKAAEPVKGLFEQ
jgi:hypothetical protein